MCVYEVVVIGAGLFGSAAAKYAAEDFPDGKTLLIGPGAGLCEDPALTKFKHISNFSSRDDWILGGAWHDEGRITKRFEYGNVWRSFVKKSMERYREIEIESGIEFFDEVGYLRIDGADDPNTHQVASELRHDGVDVHSVDDQYAKDHFSYLSLPVGYVAYHQPNKAGYISPRKLVKAQQNIASSKYGCKFLNGQADSIEEGEDNLFIVTAKEYTSKGEGGGNKNTQTITVYTKRVILATGAYANVKPDIKEILPQHLKDMSFAIDLVAETVAMVEVSEDDANVKLKGMPSMVTNYQSDCIDGTYILPPIRYPDGNWYVKIGHSKCFEDTVEHEEDAMRSWYKSGGFKEAAASLNTFLSTRLIPDLGALSVKTNCCVTTRVCSKYIS